MVRRLRALIADDDDANIEPIQQALDLEFEPLGWEVDWKYEHTSIAARQLVRRIEPFDFAIIDLFLNDDDMQDGLEVIREIRRKSSDTYCLLVTSYGNKAPGFGDEAERHDSLAIHRMELGRAKRWKFDALALEIVQHLSAVGLITTVDVDYDREDSRVMSLLSHVGRAYSPLVDRTDDQILAAGERIVRNLAVRCLGEAIGSAPSMDISYLAAGKSGAQICRIDLRAEDDPVQPFILKFGFDKGALERECRANREASKALAQQGFVPMFCDVQSDRSGYHGVAARVAVGTLTLRDWLRSSGNAPLVAVVAHVLFEELLAPLFDVKARSKVDAASWILPSSWDISRAKDTISRFAEVIEDDRVLGYRNAETRLRPLRAFLGSGRNPFQGIFDQTSVSYVRSFGDLHSANVLVPSGELPRPILIDASLYGRGHWAADVARLTVDLYLRCRRPGVDSMIWGNFSEQLGLGYRLCPYSHQGWPDAADCAESFISVVVDNALSYTQARGLELSGDDWHWQWHCALAKEFLRQASHDDLPAVRSVLGLMLAAAHMRMSLMCLRRLR